MGNKELLRGLKQTVRIALKEDIGDGDISANMIPPAHQAEARVICREEAIICGGPWVNEVFHQVDPAITIDWKMSEGQPCTANELILIVKGPAAKILTAERTALNFLQLLSGTATIARHYADLVGHTDVKVLDTRKTVPGLRLAQKYAVRVGGCYNHRLGLYDAFLIKENHIAACGGIAHAIEYARSSSPDKPVEIEVESIPELNIALSAGADIVMLDNFALEDLREAVAINNGKAKLEASGGYNDEDIVKVAETGVDYISVGALTKHCRAVDLSMRFV